MACTMSMDAMGVSKEELIDNLEYGGARNKLIPQAQYASHRNAPGSLDRHLSIRCCQ
ncbi:MAG: DsrE/DsrF/DrsH-like family protein [Candidatus Binatia bacterium]